MTILQKFILAFAVFMFGFIAAYKYQGYKYKSIIAEEKQLQAQQIIKANKAAADTEKKYQAMSDSYNLTLEKQKNELAKRAADNRAVISSRGLFVSGVCKQQVPSTTQSTGDTSDTTATIRLSETVSGYLSAAAERADQAALMAQAGHAYALLMQQWISEQSKEEKQ